jgi:hypothetical protein
LALKKYQLFTGQTLVYNDISLTCLEKKRARYIVYG